MRAYNDWDYSCSLESNDSFFQVGTAWAASSFLRSLVSGSYLQISNLGLMERDESINAILTRPEAPVVGALATRSERAVANGQAVHMPLIVINPA